MPPRPDRNEDLFDALLRKSLQERERAANAVRTALKTTQDSQATQRRATLLRAFVRQQRDGRHPVRCAWCERIRIGDGWVTAEEFLNGELPERTRELATHSICPDCYAREDEGARNGRARREHAAPCRT